MASNELLLSKIAKTIEKFSTLRNRLQPQLAIAEGLLKVGEKIEARSTVEAIAQNIPAVKEHDVHAYFDMASRLAVCLHQLNQPQRSRALLEKLRIQAFGYDNIDIRDWILYDVAIAHGNLGHLDQA